ncbi:nucleoid-associated protein [Shewanella algae]|uniref:nucleoid-associated protein n=1 Tax=Shewanella algae TaxID=38313 RepID=UPI000F42AD6F|nr:nucleoid-associated protein [Shewanella algae]AYV12344.1 nucleoid-associated protein [Shewanella algae]
MTLEINHVIIHELVKDQHKALKESNMREDVLPKDDEFVVKLVEGALEIYGRKANAAQYGCFKTKKVGDFPRLYEDYTKKAVATKQDFIKFSEDTIKEFEKSLKEGTSSPASGGYILFVDYKQAGKSYFLVAMLKNKPGLQLSKDLKPEELMHIDLNKLHQASKINKEKYELYKSATEEDKAQITYLSFVSPSTNKAAAGYFIDSIGCEKGASSTISTRLVIKHVPKFFREEQALNSKDALKVKSDILRYMDDCANATPLKVAKLSEIEGLARAYFPNDQPDTADNLGEKLFALLNGDEVGIPVEFSVNKNEISKAQKHKLVSNNWTLSVEKSAIGIGENAEVRYVNNTLVISRLSYEMQQEIEADLMEKGLLNHD